MQLLSVIVSDACVHVVNQIPPSTVDSGSCLLAGQTGITKKAASHASRVPADRSRQASRPFQSRLTRHCSVPIQFLFTCCCSKLRYCRRLVKLYSDLSFCTTSLLIEYDLDSVDALGSRICRLLCTRISGWSKSLCNFKTRGSRFHTLEKRLQAIHLHSIWFIISQSLQLKSGVWMPCSGWPMKLWLCLCLTSTSQAFTGHDQV